ncbi:MAG: T9SS type A sorting domain-containing protein [Bacteroidia bacterium]
MKIRLLIALLSIFGMVQGQGVWTQKANFGGSGRTSAVGFSIGTKGYIGTGSDIIGVKKDFWEWDPTTNSWTQKADFGGVARKGAVGFSIGQKGYIGTGGLDLFSGSYFNDFWEYDPAGNSWVQKAAFGGTARYAAVGFSINAKGYLGLGDDTGAGMHDFWEYDQISDSWTQIASISITPALMFAAGFSIGNKGYVGTGWDGTQTHNDFWEYDPALNLWTQKANFSGSIRTAAVGFSIGNKGFIGTGQYAIFENDFWEYDPATNSWTQRVNVSGIGRRDAVAFSIGNKGYIGVGQDTSGFTTDFWEYHDTTALSVSEVENKIHLTIFPNPFSSSTNLLSDQFLNNATLTVYNSIGQQVKQINNISGQTVFLKRDNLPVGLYFIRLTLYNKVLSIEKLVITD